MESWKGCVQQLDTKNMPQFLDQVSDARENEASRHFAISLYAELAQVHKQAVIPYIPRIMASIVRSLPFSADTQQLHQACAKVVASVARYTIEPTKPYDSNQQILCNLCSPLLPALAGKLESSAAGAAICLQAVVESEKWKFAHPDLQDLICSKATAALVEGGARIVPLLHLVKSLAKFCKDASQEHVAEWLGIGLQVLQADMGIWQQRVAAAQLIAIILKTADAEKLGVDLHATAKILEACLVDNVTVVQVAVAEAFETANRVALKKHRFCEVESGCSTCGEPELLESSCQSRQKNSYTEESGLQDLSDSISPRSGASSHEAVPSMASSSVKTGMGTKRSRQRAKNSFCLSHATPSLSRPSELKENIPATIPRRVLSEIPASGKLLSNLEVLPSSCVSKPVRRSSMDFGSKIGNYLMQNQASFGYGKGLQHVHDCAMRTSSLEKKHVEGCQNFSNMGCTCKLDLDKHGNIRLGNLADSSDHLNGEAGADDHKSTESARDMLKSGCTDDALSSKDTSKGTRSEESNASDKGGHVKVAKAHVPSKGFAFRAPSSLSHSLQSGSSMQRRGWGCKECRDADTELCRQASWMKSDGVTSGESEEGQVDSQSRDGTSNASCCTLEDFSASVNRDYTSGSYIHRQNFRLPNNLVLNDREIHSSGQGWLSSKDSSGSEIDNDEKTKARQNDNNLERSIKENGLQKHHLAPQLECHTELSAAPNLNFSGAHYSGKGSTVSEVSKQICAGAGFGLVCAVGILVLAVMVIQHVNHSYGLHALVPT